MREGGYVIKGVRKREIVSRGEHAASVDHALDTSSAWDGRFLFVTVIVGGDPVLVKDEISCQVAVVRLRGYVASTRRRKRAPQKAEPQLNYCFT
jgi:hypothetical protein